MTTNANKPGKTAQLRKENDMASTIPQVPGAREGTPEEYAWAAGYLEALGIVNAVQGRVQLIMKTTRNDYAMKKLAEIAGVETKIFLSPTQRKGLQFSFGGEHLHNFLIKLWPYLTPYRKVEYKEAVRKARIQLESQ